MGSTDIIWSTYRAESMILGVLMSDELWCSWRLFGLAFVAPGRTERGMDGMDGVDGMTEHDTMSLCAGQD